MSTLNRASWVARLAVIGASLLLYVLACALPTVYFDRPSYEPWPGLMAFIMGGIAVLEGYLAWLANPIYGIALLLVLFRQWIAATSLVLVAFLVAMLALQVIGDTVPLDEGGVNKAVATGLGPGFYVWLASMVMLAPAALTLRFYERSSSSS